MIVPRDVTTNQFDTQRTGRMGKASLEILTAL